jgi:cytochrome c peroxidase
MPSFNPEQLNLFAPIPEGVDKPVLDEPTKLGRALYFDKSLSAGNDVSCASCHDLARAGADGAATSTGTKGRKGKRNTPTIFNAGGSFAQGWDGKTPTMDDFIAAHVVDPAIMGADAKRIQGKYGAIAAYAQKLFARSRWDRYLAGDKSTMTDAELGGFAMFVEAGCTSCHQGKYIGATQAQRLGIAKPWPPPTEPGPFKVPTLRNVTKTAPYLHDGSVATLDETIRLMARHQVGRELTDVQVKAIATFLGALEGDPPKELQKSK